MDRMSSGYQSSASSRASLTLVVPSVSHGYGRKTTAGSPQGKCSIFPEMPPFVASHVSAVDAPTALPVRRTSTSGLASLIHGMPPSP